MSSPVAITDAGGRLQVVRSMFGASGQALVDLLIHSTTILCLPAGLAVALTVDAGSVARAGGIQTVGCCCTVGGWWMDKKNGHGIIMLVSQLNSLHTHSSRYKATYKSGQCHSCEST